MRNVTPRAATGQPFALNVETIAYAFAISKLAHELIDAILDHRPTARIMRELIVDLEGMDSSSAIAVLSDTAGDVSADLAAAAFNKVEMRNGSLLFWNEPAE